MTPREQMAWESCWLTMSRRGALSGRITFHLAWSPWRITWLHEGQELVVRGRTVSDVVEKAMAWADARRSLVPPAPDPR